MVVIEVGPYRASIENYKWSCKNAEFLKYLNYNLPKDGRSPSEPNPDFAAAKEIVDKLGGKIIRHDKVESTDEELIY